MYTVYVLYSKKYDKIYIGQTEDLSKRIVRHNNGKVKSTKPYLPWEVVYCESYKTRSESVLREKELKTHKGRDFIREKIEDG